MGYHRVRNHLFTIWDSLVGFDSVEKRGEEVLFEEGRLGWVREVPSEMELDGLVQILAQGSMPHAKRLDSVPKDQVHRITCKEIVSCVDGSDRHAWIGHMNCFAELQVVNEPGLLSTMLFSLRGSESFFVNNVSVIAESSSGLGRKRRQPRS